MILRLGNLFIYLFLFIKTLQHKCWRSVGHQVLQPAKDVKFGQYVWKVAGRRKNPWCTKTASDLQPSDLRSNAYRSLPGDRDIFSLLFSYIYIHRNPRKWLIIFKYFLWNLMDIVLFIKTYLQNDGFITAIIMQHYNCFY